MFILLEKHNKILANIKEELDMKNFLILILFQALLIYLKLTNFIDWSWFYVLFPILSQLLTIIAVIILGTVTGVVSGVLNAVIRKLDDDK
jgi:hypothetical protein